MERPQLDAKIIHVDTWERAHELAMVAAFNGGCNVTADRTPRQLHIRRSHDEQLLAIVVVAEAEGGSSRRAMSEANDG